MNSIVWMKKLDLKTLWFPCFLVLYFFIMTYVCYLRYFYGIASAWDLGLMNQVINSASRLELMYYTAEPWWCGKEPCSYFAVHFSPILYSLVPVYWIWPHVLTLLVIKNLMIVFSGIVLYFLSKEITKNVLFSKLVVLIYLLHPGIIGAILFDFHPECFFPLFFFLGIYGIEKKFYPLTILSTLTLFMTLEYFCIFVPLVLSCYLLFYKGNLKNKKMWIFCIFFLLLGFSVYKSEILFMKKFRGKSLKSEFLLKDIENTLKLYHGFLNAVKHNLNKKVFYVVALFLPFLFIPFRRPWLLLVLLPWFFLSFVMNIEPYYRLDMQYSFFVVPIIVVAFLYSSVGIMDRIMNKKFLSLFFLSILFCFYVNYQLYNIRFAKHQISNCYFNYRKVIDLVPVNNSGKYVLPDNVFVYYSNRENVYPIVSFLITKISKLNEQKLYWFDYYLTKLNATYIAVNFNRMVIPLRKRFFKKLNRSKYHLIAYFNNVYIFKQTNKCHLKYFIPRRVFLKSRYLASIYRCSNDSYLICLGQDNPLFLPKGFCEVGYRIDLYPGSYNLRFMGLFNRPSVPILKICPVDGEKCLFIKGYESRHEIIFNFTLKYYDFYNICLANLSSGLINAMEINYTNPCLGGS